MANGKWYGQGGEMSDKFNQQQNAWMASPEHKRRQKKMTSRLKTVNKVKQNSSASRNVYAPPGGKTPSAKPTPWKDILSNLPFQKERKPPVPGSPQDWRQNKPGPGEWGPQRWWKTGETPMKDWWKQRPEQWGGTGYEPSKPHDPGKPGVPVQPFGGEGDLPTTYPEAIDELPTWEPPPAVQPPGVAPPPEDLWGDRYGAMPDEIKGLDPNVTGFLGGVMNQDFLGPEAEQAYGDTMQAQIQEG